MRLVRGVRSKDFSTMTSFRVELPENFDFNRQEEWPKCSRRFERFRTMSGLSKKEEEESQIKTQIFAMGDEADYTLHSFRLNTMQLKQCHTAKTRFERCKNKATQDRNVVGLLDAKLSEKLPIRCRTNLDKSNHSSATKRSCQKSNKRY